MGALGFTRGTQNGLLLGSTPGQVSTAHGYTAFGELSGDTVRHGGAVIFARGYTRDDLGRISGITETAGHRVEVRRAPASARTHTGQPKKRSAC